MKKLFILLIVMFVTASYICGFSLMNTMAGERSRSEKTPYYTSVMIQKGDSLWTIAKEYNTNGYLTTSEYVEYLKDMNQLKTETIHAGQFLMIEYYKE